MKKSLLICILVMILCLSVVFTACSTLDAETLDSMKELIYQMYKDGNPANTYEVVAMVASNGEKANIAWTVKVNEGPQDSVKIGKLENNKQTIEIDPRPASAVKYTLTATLVNEKGKEYKVDGAPVSVSFERTLNAFVINTYEEYLEACIANDGRQIRIQGYVIGVVCMESSSKGSLYIQDANGHGYYAYAPVGATDGCETTDQLRAKWPIGTEVLVTGTVTTYNGQYEFNKNCEIEVTGKTVTDAQLPYADATAAFAAATSNEDTALAEYQNRRVELKGAIITRIDETGTKGGSDYKAYYYFKLPGSEVEFNVYYTIYFLDAATANTVCDKLVVGKQVDLKGIISVYSKDFQVYPDSANSVSNVRDVEYTDAEKIAIAKENLTIATSAKQGDELALPATGDLGTTIAWAFATGKTYDFATLAEGKLTITATPDATTDVELVATITSGTTTDTKTFKVSVAASFILNETHAYAGFVNQVTAQKGIYLDGGVSGRYLTTTTDASKAVAVYAEKATGGYKLYILDGTTKKYITIYSNSDNKDSVKYDENGTTVYSYNPTVNAFVANFNGTDKYLGTYNNFETISVSNLSYITAENTGVSQFPLELLPAVDGGSYNASLKQVNLQGKVIYLNGGVDGRYLTTTENVAEAVAIYAEKVEGGYKFYKLNGTTKEYITVYANADNKDSVKFDAAGTTVYNYDPTLNAWYTNFAGKDKYLGTYNNFTTISVSNLSYITAENTGVSQFPLVYAPVAAPATGAPEQGGEQGGEGTTPPAGGEAESAGLSIVLNSTANKVSATGEALVFAKEGVTITISKANSTNDLVDQTGNGYAARIYKGATLTVAGSQITKIVLTCDSYTSNGSTYYSGFDGMTVNGATITRDGLVITIVFASATDSFTSAPVSSQTRIMSVEVFTGNSTEGGEGTTPPTGGEQGGEGTTPPASAAKYVLVTDISTLAAGDKIIIVGFNHDVALSVKSDNSKFRTSVAITKSGNQISAVTGLVELTLGKSGNNWTFSDGTGFLGYPGSGNEMHTLASDAGNKIEWTITIDGDGKATITNVSATDRVMQYNASAPRFAGYTGSQQPISIYKLVEAE
ncbi:MAG: hypothetical protein J6Q55_01800 [Clostridia bacterium]|nr:hypothetical protein [Clostridia bacterium]